MADPTAKASTKGPDVDPMDLYTLRFRRGMAGVQTGFLRASSLTKAEEVGHTYCNSLTGCQYISVVRSILADESILTGDAGVELRRNLASA